MTETMQRIALARRPMGTPVEDDFLLENIPMPVPAEGEVLVKVHFMSLDPYMRGHMDDTKSYANPVPIGGTMEGGAVGQVVASNAVEYAVGDYVFGMLGWASLKPVKPLLWQRLPDLLAQWWVKWLRRAACARSALRAGQKMCARG